MLKLRFYAAASAIGSLLALLYSGAQAAPTAITINVRDFSGGVGYSPKDQAGINTAGYIPVQIYQGNAGPGPSNGASYNQFQPRLTQGGQVGGYRPVTPPTYGPPPYNPPAANPSGQ